jgi:hypothetical protein
MPSSGMWRRVGLVNTDVPPKRQLSQDPSGTTYQKTTFFTATAVETSNLT